MTIFSLDVLLSQFEPVCCFMFGSNNCFLTCTQMSQEAGNVVWYFYLFKTLPHFVATHTVKGFSAVDSLLGYMFKISLFSLLLVFLSL